MNEQEQYVYDLYTSILGRAPDPQGFADNLAALQSGAVDAAGLANAFSSSQEAQNNASSGGGGGGGGGGAPAPSGGGVDLNALYQQYLGRAPDASGIATWSGRSADEIINGIVNSAEYQATRGGGGGGSTAPANTNAKALAEQVFNLYATNQNYDQQLNQLNSLAQTNPAAFYEARIGLLGKQMGWQTGQNTGERNIVYENELNSLIPGALAAGMTTDQINNLVGSNAVSASQQNQARIAQDAASGAGKGWVNQNIPGGWTTVALAAALAAGGAGAAGLFGEGAVGAGLGEGAIGADVFGGLAGTGGSYAGLTAAEQAAAAAAAAGATGAGGTMLTVPEILASGGFTSTAGGAGFTLPELGAAGAAAGGAGVAGSAAGAGGAAGGAATTAATGAGLGAIGSLIGGLGVGDLAKYALAGTALAGAAGFLGNSTPNYGDGGAAALEAARQKRAMEATNAINAVFNGSNRKALYDAQRKAIYDLNANEVNRQAVVAERNNRFGLARNGLIGGSADIDSNAELNRKTNVGLLQAGGIADQSAADLQAADAKTQSNLISMAQTGIDTGSAANLAASGLNANLSQAAAQRGGASIGSLFNDLSQAYLYNQQQQGAAMGAAYGRQNYGNSTRSGGFNGSVTSTN